MQSCSNPARWRPLHARMRMGKVELDHTELQLSLLRTDQARTIRARRVGRELYIYTHIPTDRAVALAAQYSVLRTGHPRVSATREHCSRLPTARHMRTEGRARPEGPITLLLPPRDDQRLHSNLHEHGRIGPKMRAARAQSAPFGERDRDPGAAPKARLPSLHLPRWLAQLHRREPARLRG